MKNNMLLLISFLTFNITFGQENSGTNNARLKLYINGYYQESKESSVFEYTNYTSYITFSNKDFDFGKLAFAIEFNQNKKFRHEVGLRDFTFNREDSKITIKESNNGISNVTSSEKTTTLGSAIRYQFNYYFLNSKPVCPFVACSPTFFMYYNKIEPTTSLSFPSKHTDIYIPFDIILGVEFKFSEHFSLNTDIPFTFYQFGYEREFIDNPQLAENFRKTSTINGESFPKQYCFRFGVSYRL